MGLFVLNRAGQHTQYTEIFSVVGRVRNNSLKQTCDALHQLYWLVKSQRCLFKSILTERAWLLGLALIICFQSSFEQVTES